MRNVAGRLAWFLSTRPVASGRCAEHVMHSIDLPRQGLPDATAVARKVAADGHMQRTRVVPRGAIRYWTGGSDGHGHVALEHAPIAWPSTVASTDVEGPRTVGVKPFGWFGTHWGNLRYVGWSWWFGGINTEEEPVGITTPPPYRNIKVSTPQKIPLNQWTTIDLGKQDAITPPVGSDDFWVQLHLALASATVDRNSLRYVKGRWSRHTSAGPDTHGTDTKAIPPDLPKDSWQSAFSTDMRGLQGVPVSFEVYIGATHDGTITSPMRLYTVDNEET